MVLTSVNRSSAGSRLLSKVHSRRASVSLATDTTEEPHPESFFKPMKLDPKNYLTGVSYE